jgi:hypothetical protein
MAWRISRKSLRMVSILVPSKRSALSSTVRRADW